jgi:prefoldin beta subunit
MAEEVPKQIQDKLVQFQNMQNQLQMINAQKQQLMLKSADIDNALEELEKMDKGKVYKLAGPLMIETSKEESKKSLTDNKEISKTRLDMLEKQEKKIMEKLTGLRAELQTMMNENQPQQ